MSIAQQLQDRGRKVGIQPGIQKGMQKAMQKAMQKMARCLLADKKRKVMTDPRHL